MKILIAEDEEMSQEVLHTLLEDLGHQVVVAADGEEAWEKFQEGGIQVIVSDWMMPRADGLELCRRVRARRHSHYVYFILLTVLTGKDNYMDGMEAGADDFITKPYDRDQLLTRLHVAQRILSMHTELSQLRSLLSICSYCKKIRDAENDHWMTVEKFISTATPTDLSHGICPECYDNIVGPELEEWKQRTEQGRE